MQDGGTLLFDDVPTFTKLCLFCESLHAFLAASLTKKVHYIVHIIQVI